MRNIQAIKDLLATLASEENMDSIESLSGEISERDELLSGMGTFADDEETGERTYTATPVENTDDSGWKEKYESLKKQYIDHFFSNTEKGIEDEIEEHEEDLADTISIEDLYEEGDK